MLCFADEIHAAAGNDDGDDDEKEEVSFEFLKADASDGPRISGDEVRDLEGKDLALGTCATMIARSCTFA
eukprot:1157312-Pelagomonas_calceolata.AAC.2